MNQSRRMTLVGDGSQALINSDTPVAENADWFSSDFQPTRADGVTVISLVMSSKVDVWLVPSEGSPILVQQSAGYVIDMPFEHRCALDPERSWNIQAQTAGGTTVKFCNVQEILP